MPRELADILGIKVSMSPVLVRALHRFEDAHEGPECAKQYVEGTASASAEERCVTRYVGNPCTN